MQDDSQLQVPPSFVALYTERQRLTVTREALLERFDLCEDLANHLVDFAKSVHYQQGVSEDEVLARCRRGLLAEPSDVSPAEAQWIAYRLAEILGWQADVEDAGPDRGQ
jgi:hypothetical protein